ncbi:hypothetical protein SOASR030_24740 [Leminorella grimontii]|uniref:Tail fiber assembly protein n=1 Tax=Leminorella grimontii TaxID=82981 RepID=A0AAV5N3L0_9GAMM|nr:tail fiber assembly protein [Leminorella grimontii]KFC95042.1 tail fiber assembly protein [Leminorella grimontii ATCC 33999 = DSM 5078]GKX56362.1 hypothetical protein SOASR030_24740 [Leminorella grimontii]
MKYAIVNGQGIVENVVIADDTSAFDITGLYVVEVDAAGPGWIYQDGKFSPPPEPELTGAELHVAAEGEKLARLQAANVIIAMLADAVEFSMATPAEHQRYDEWRRYRVLLTRVDTAAVPVNWPLSPAE